MDEIYLDYDPRNAVVVRPPLINQPNRPFQPFQPFQPYGGAVVPRPVAAPRSIFGSLQAPIQTQPAYYAPPPAYPPQAYYPPGYYPAPTAASKLGSKLSDLTVGDVVPLLAQLIIAFRPMPAAPGDEGSLGTNVLNLTKFVDAIGRHFHADQQLNAAGAVAGTFLR